MYGPPIESLEPPRDRCREIERLEAIVNRLPKTADGAAVLPGMTLWDRNFDTILVDWVSLHREGQGARFYQTNYCDVVMENCYSTREAAEAASKRDN